MFTRDTFISTYQLAYKYIVFLGVEDDGFFPQSKTLKSYLKPCTTNLTFLVDLITEKSLSIIDTVT